MTTRFLETTKPIRTGVQIAEMPDWMHPSVVAGFGFGLYLNSFVLSALFILPQKLVYLAGTLLGVGTILFALLSHGCRLSRDELLRWQFVVGSFFVILSTSYFVNSQAYDWGLTFKVIGYGSLVTICSGIALVGGHRCVSSCVVTYLAGAFFAVAVIIAFDNVNPVNGRLMGPFRAVGIQAEGLHPNDAAQLGMMAVILATSFGWRGVLSMFPIAMYLAIRCSSRGAMIGSIMTVGLYFVFHELISRSANRDLFVLPKRGILLSGAAVVFLIVLSGLVGPYVLDELLLRKDHQRGLSSGFTGRQDVWRKLFESFLSSPVLGHGYGVVKAEADVNQATVDGGFLLLMAELGGVGLIFYLSLISITMKKLWASVVRGQNRLAVTSIIFLIVFCFLNIFESKIVGVGSNGLGFFFFLISLWVVSDEAGSRIEIRGVTSGDDVPRRSVQS